MSFDPRTQPSASFTGRPANSGYTRLFGDMSEDDFIVLLGFSPSDETVIQQAGGKLYGDLVELDVIDVSGLAFTARVAPSGSFTPRDLPV